VKSVIRDLVTSTTILEQLTGEIFSKLYQLSPYSSFLFIAQATISIEIGWYVNSTFSYEKLGHSFK